MSEKLSLQWNDFQGNVKSSFRNLRKSSDFVDVTLACEDGHQIEAHRFILASSSPFFRDILKQSNHSHPLIFMRGVKSDDLVAMVDFMYFGEANVDRDNLDSFLAISEELQLKGLKSSDDEKGMKEKELKEGETNKQDTQIAALESKQTLQRNRNSQTRKGGKNSKITGDPKTELRLESKSLAMPPPFVSSGDCQQLEESVKPMAAGRKSESTRTKKAKNGSEKVSIPCQFCDEMFGASLNKMKFTSNNRLKKHIIRFHKEAQELRYNVLEAQAFLEKVIAESVSHN